MLLISLTSRDSACKLKCYLQLSHSSGQAVDQSMERLDSRQGPNRIHQKNKSEIKTLGFRP